MNLSPEILKMRDALLERIGNKPLKDVANIVNEILLNETNGTNRLAALAARVKVLRDHINKNFEIEGKIKKNNLANKIQNKQHNNTDEQETNQNITSEKEVVKEEKWVRVEMLKSGVVNGVRFPEGVVIDVSQVDAQKLKEDGLSKIIEINDSEKDKPQESAPAEEETKNTEVKLKDKSLDSTPAEEVAKSADAKPEDKPQESKPAEEVAKSADAKPEDKPQESKPAEKIVQNENLEQNEMNVNEKKILKTKSTKITEETIELTDPKAVAEALGLNEKKKKENEPIEVEEEIDLEALETGKKK